MAKKWIQDAIKNPGAFTAKAKQAGGMTKQGTIKQSFVDKAKNSPNPTTRKQANLADTLGKMRKK